MSKSKKEETPQTLPVIKSYLLKKVGAGWAVIEFSTQGDKVLSVKQICDPDMKAISSAKLLQFFKE